jgi:hypothetical protein
VSLDTEEVKYAEQRQQHLVDQGFFFEIIQELPFMKKPREKERLIMSSEKDQAALLTNIMQSEQAIERDKGIENLKGLEKDEDLLLIRKNQERDMD